MATAAWNWTIGASVLSTIIQSSKWINPLPFPRLISWQTQDVLACWQDLGSMAKVGQDLFGSSSCSRNLRHVWENGQCNSNFSPPSFSFALPESLSRLQQSGNELMRHPLLDLYTQWPGWPFPTDFLGRTSHVNKLDFEFLLRNVDHPILKLSHGPFRSSNT